MVRKLLTALFITVATGSCAHYPVNTAGAVPATAGYRFDNFPATADNSDALFVVLALSGGGARAAAFSYGVMEQLQQTTVVRNGRTSTLMEEVDVIAPASASAFVAAYYALHRAYTFRTFPSRFLEGDLQARVIGATANPGNWPRLLAPAYDRVDLAAETYDNALFDRHTYADLVRARQRPYLLLSATDVSLGRRFEFSQEQFDCLNSDLGSVSLARAVAASAAFPVAFNPITFENYATGDRKGEPAWVEGILENRKAPAWQVTRAQDLRSYADGTARKHIRLLDGAISDYTGLTPILQSYTSTIGDFSIRRMIQSGRIKHLVVISVNAVRTPGVEWDAKESAPNWIDMLYMTASEPIRNRAYETIAQFREAIENDPATQSGTFDAHLITLDFTGVDDPALRSRLETIRTTLSLTKSDAADMRRAAGEAVRNSAEMRQVLADLNSEK